MDERRVYGFVTEPDYFLYTPQPKPKPEAEAPQTATPKPEPQQTNELAPAPQPEALPPDPPKAPVHRPNRALTAERPEDLSSLPPLERHRRKCQVCNHPDRDSIDSEYLEWFATWAISQEYKVPVRALQRHFRAMGYITRRRERLEGVLDHIMEKASTAKCTGDTVLRAVRVATCLRDGNRWIEPSSNVVFSTQPRPIDVTPEIPAPKTPALGEPNGE
jgi:hypothetical protein